MKKIFYLLVTMPILLTGCSGGASPSLPSSSVVPSTSSSNSSTVSSASTGGYSSSSSTSTSETVVKYQVNVYSNDETKGTVSGSGKYEAGFNVIINAIPSDDCVFEGWYSDSEFNNLLSEEVSYTFLMPANDANFYAKFLTNKEVWDKAHGVVPVVDKDSGTVTYGLYPQTNVDDSSLITALDSLTTPESNGWYFYENEYYAKLTAKPYNDEYKFNNGTTIVWRQTYWFKCEPITWNILSNNESNYFVLSSVLLDAHRYAASKNNYKNSEIRSWLNNDFYSAAFDLDSSFILTTEVDNSPSTTDSSPNPYACENTFDKVFLPSYKDYINSLYGFSTSTGSSKTRECKMTDYARANGADCHTWSSYLNNGYYWTRSPVSDDSDFAWRVNLDGTIDYTDVFQSSHCVRPSLTLNIAE